MPRQPRKQVAKDAGRMVVYGASGTGKSTFVKELIAGSDRVIVFDTQDEYRDYGYRRFNKLPDLGRYVEGAKGRVRACYVPPVGSEAVALHQLSRCLTAVQRHYKSGQSKAKITMVAEELNLGFPVTAWKAELNGFPNVCSRSRHSGIEVIGVSQRPAEVNTRFRGNCDGFVFFRLAENVDIRVAAQMMGAEWAAKVRDLDDHHYVTFRKGKISQGKNSLKS